MQWRPLPGPAMLNKNLRSLLSYVAGVSLLCLMIEFSRRLPDTPATLSPALYHVRTAKDSELATDPTDTKPDDYDVIPKRNRGRVGKIKQTQSLSVSENLVDTSEKAKFKAWKSLIKFDPNETGLFKKWKKLQLEEEAEDEIAEESETEEEFAKFKAWKSSLKGDTSEKGLFKKWKKLKTTTTTTEVSVVNEIEDEELKSDEDIDLTNEKEDDTEEEEEETASETDDLIDYPSGLTEYEPADWEHSCSEFTMTEPLLERQQEVVAACNRLQDELGDQRRLYSRLRWAVPQRLLYCPVFKAASTSWLINYLKLSNSTTNPKQGNLHTKITNLFPPPATFKLRKQIYAESVKFIIVRHPFERLVSAYRDKLAGFSRNEHYLNMRKHIIQKYRKKTRDKSAIPTFRESVDFVMAELEAMESGASKLVIDGHFMPYSRRCLPCAMKYDLIIKFETLEEDSKYLIDQCRLSDKLKVGHENAAPTGARTAQGQKNKSKKVKSGKSLPERKPSSAEQSLDYFKTIPVSKIKKLYEYYRHDFEIFGYSADIYLEEEERE